MNQLFSKRNGQKPDVYRYDVPRQTRWRIVHTLQGLANDTEETFDLEELLEEVGQKLLQKYGGLHRSGFAAANESSHPVLNHFLTCRDELALDFLELCFQTRRGCCRQKGVDGINGVLVDDALGYELTPWREILTSEKKPIFGDFGPLANCFKIQHPQIIKKSDQFVHSEIIQPCLVALGSPIFATANSELLNAMQAYKQGRFADSLTSCGSSFESVLKTICTEFEWPFDPDKDTCSKLVGICRDNGLFPSFYGPIFESTGTIRNKLGDAHGRGPSPLYTVGKEHVEHMIKMTAAHIVLLVGLAKL